MRHAVNSHKQAWDDSDSALLATKLTISLEANIFIQEGDSLIAIIGFKKAKSDYRLNLLPGTLFSTDSSM